MTPSPSSTRYASAPTSDLTLSEALVVGSATGVDLTLLERLLLGLADL